MANGFNTVNISSVNESGLPLGGQSQKQIAFSFRARLHFGKTPRLYMRDRTNIVWRWTSVLLCTDSVVFALNIRHLDA